MIREREERRNVGPCLAVTLGHLHLREINLEGGNREGEARRESPGEGTQMMVLGATIWNLPLHSQYQKENMLTRRWLTSEKPLIKVLSEIAKWILGMMNAEEPAQPTVQMT